MQTFKQFMLGRAEAYYRRNKYFEEHKDQHALAEKLSAYVLGISKIIPEMGISHTGNWHHVIEVNMYMTEESNRSITTVIDDVMDRIDFYVEKQGFKLDPDSCHVTSQKIYVFSYKKEEIKIQIFIDTEAMCEMVQVGMQPKYEYKCKEEV